MLLYGRGGCGSITLRDTLLGTPDLVGLFGEELVALLTDLDDLLAGKTEVLDGGEDLLGDLGGRLVLGEGVGVVEGIICPPKSAIASKALTSSDVVFVPS